MQKEWQRENGFVRASGNEIVHGRFYLDGCEVLNLNFCFEPGIYFPYRAKDCLSGWNVVLASQHYDEAMAEAENWFFERHQELIGHDGKVDDLLSDAYTRFQEANVSTAGRQDVDFGKD